MSNKMAISRFRGNTAFQIETALRPTLRRIAMLSKSVFRKLKMCKTK